jgi:hypothetical protein
MAIQEMRLFICRRRLTFLKFCLPLLEREWLKDVPAAGGEIARSDPRSTSFVPTPHHAMASEANCHAA